MTMEVAEAVESDRPIRHTRDVVGSALTVTVAAVALQRSISYGLDSQTQVVGPGTYPAAVSAVMLILGLTWVVQTWRRRVPEPEEPVVWPDAQGYRRILITIVAIFVVAMTMAFIDFRLTIFAVSFVILRFVFAQSLVVTVSVSAAMSAVCYLGLSVGLGMVLPLSF